MRIDQVSEDILLGFLLEEFHAVEGFDVDEERRAKDFQAYAHIAKALSEAGAIQELARRLAIELRERYCSKKYVSKDGQTYRIVGAFSNALKDYAGHFGFSSELVLLNGPVENRVFAEQVYAKRLFRDVYTRPHGEFTHALQWLLFGDQFENIANLYSRSVKYLSKSTFQSGKEASRIVMWQFLVDCFDGDENYSANILCKTFRCPQIFTNRLVEILPSGAWLGNFIMARRQKGLSSGVPPYEDGHYTSGRQVTMPTNYLNRTLRYPDGEVAQVYTEVSTNVYKKDLLEAQPVAQAEQGFRVTRL
ncbi:LirA/MavJ family T4SS effector [Dyella nitratireducens]|uniref:DUF5636 domain-containing protein n=1 Tax=Dyella nitratireducens TaxID=1849580 RepID=A0ABQ1G7W5_9GAMM|nr:LirA/MavJ family T4SS effector [Dyella nitratireducens]GGA38487.1 hypothetical protein GCM10010981_29630 [Dyella nitratireducens]GLQ40320.1 hypothetical protein GCM10007902_01690 [Dyella nitratireducens]